MRVIHCAHSGILWIGVKRPLIRIRISMKNHMTNMACCNVVECSCVTGDFSMLIEVVFKDTAALDKFIGELQHFGKTKTQIVFSTSVEHRDFFYKIRE